MQAGIHEDTVAEEALIQQAVPEQGIKITPYSL